MKCCGPIVVVTGVLLCVIALPYFAIAGAAYFNVENHQYGAWWAAIVTFAVGVMAIQNYKNKWAYIVFRLFAVGGAATAIIGAVLDRQGFDFYDQFDTCFATDTYELYDGSGSYSYYGDDGEYFECLGMHIGGDDNTYNGDDKDLPDKYDGYDCICAYDDTEDCHKFSVVGSCRDILLNQANFLTVCQVFGSIVAAGMLLLALLPEEYMKGKDTNDFELLCLGLMCRRKVAQQTPMEPVTPGISSSTNHNNDNSGRGTSSARRNVTNTTTVNIEMDAAQRQAAAVILQRMARNRSGSDGDLFGSGGRGFPSNPSNHSRGFPSRGPAAAAATGSNTNIFMDAYPAMASASPVPDESAAAETAYVDKSEATAPPEPAEHGSYAGYAVPLATATYVSAVPAASPPAASTPTSDPSAPSSPPGTSTGGGDGGGGARSVMQRLAMAEQLRSSGAISEAEYQRTREHILSEL